MERFITAGDRGDELIGIWWYDEASDLIFGFAKPTSCGYNDFGNIQYDKVQNHMTLKSNLGNMGIYPEDEYI